MGGQAGAAAHAGGSGEAAEAIHGKLAALSIFRRGASTHWALPERLAVEVHLERAKQADRQGRDGISFRRGGCLMDVHLK
jgi:hypothetical protein